MQLIRIFITLFLTLLAATAPLTAQDAVPDGVVWQATTAKSRILPGEMIETEFVFTNRTSHPVHLHRVEADCRCVFPEENWNQPVPPGQSGSLKVRFTPEGRHGTQTKRLWASTSVSPERMTEFVWTIEILPVLSFDPPGLELAWKPGKTADPKIITVKKIEPVKDLELSVETTSKNFGVDIDNSQAGRGVWKIRVWPEFPAEENEGIIFVRSNFPPIYPRMYILLARVKK